MKYLPIDPSLFIENRARFRRHLCPGAVAVFHSADVLPKSADGIHPFCQQTDLFYLTGIDQEETVLFLFPDAREEKYREILFIRESKEELVIWEGPKLDKASAERISGIKTIFYTHEFEKVFRSQVFFAETIFLNTNEHLRADVSIRTRDDRFIEWCKKAFPLHRYERAAPILHHLRAIKSETEIALIKHACRITGRTFRRLCSFIRPGIWEFDIEAEIWKSFISMRSAGPAYESIAASGPNTCILHYVKNNRQLQAGDLVLLDFGAEYAHYASDLTRTIPVSGRFSPRQKDVYEAVLRVQKAAAGMLRPGNTIDEIQKETAKKVEAELIGLGLLDSRKVKDQDESEPLYKKYFMHGVGHHMGLDVHDYGCRYRKLSPGMVITCEPGIYIREEGLGVRIETDILVTDTLPLDLMEDVPVTVEEIETAMAPK